MNFGDLKPRNYQSQLQTSPKNKRNSQAIQMLASWPDGFGPFSKEIGEVGPNIPSCKFCRTNGVSIKKKA